MNNGVNDNTNVVNNTVPVSNVPVQPMNSEGVAVQSVPVNNVVAPQQVVANAPVENVEPIYAPVEQNIPGVVVAPPQNNGMEQPKPIQPLEVVEEEQPKVEEKKEEQVVEPVVPKKKKNPFFIILLLLIIIGLGGYIYYMDMQHKMVIKQMEYKCTPISATENKKLELDSVVVQDLYSKVKTTIREDLALFELNDQMKLYLAYRQIPSSKYYDSNCNLFSNTAMEPFTCNDSASFTPLAFKEEDLLLEVKKLFGNDVTIPYSHINLGNGSCLGGYQYIADRGEFVQGVCSSVSATSFKVEKELVGAESNEAYITLREKVRYYNADGVALPEKFKSGVYVYKFKLDMNYNYIYVSKELEVK